MSTREKLIKARMSMLALAEELQNVSGACKRAGLIPLDLERDLRCHRLAGHSAAVKLRAARCYWSSCRKAFSCVRAFFHAL